MVDTQLNYGVWSMVYLSCRCIFGNTYDEALVTDFYRVLKAFRTGHFLISLGKKDKETDDRRKNPQKIILAHPVIKVQELPPSSHAVNRIQRSITKRFN